MAKRVEGCALHVGIGLCRLLSGFRVCIFLCFLDLGRKSAVRTAAHEDPLIVIREHVPVCPSSALSLGNRLFILLEIVNAVKLSSSMQTYVIPLCWCPMAKSEHFDAIVFELPYD